MKTLNHVKTKSAQKVDRLEELDQKLDLLLHKINELQVEVSRISKRQKPLIH